MSEEPEDPYLDEAIEAEVARVVGPTAGVLPEEIREELTFLLRIGLRANPDARALLEELRPAPSVQRSDKIATAAFKQRKQSRSGGER